MAEKEVNMQHNLSKLGIDVRIDEASMIFSDSVLLDDSISGSQKEKIVALREIIRICNESVPDKPMIVKKAEDAMLLMKDRLRHLTHEELHLILMKRNNGVISTVMVTKGGLDSTVIDTGQIALEALKTNAKCVILVHNHPSGSSLPSKSDIENTKKIKKALELFGIQMLDHLIISSGEYFSFAEEEIKKY